ncbi:hypothetical protein CRENBAI_023372 [Crenichthys baileyi]|uniref:Uncharacterized protein n=1 Tax=Crenichthys baileyi TaxID=28760 RepID=A0AAV9S2Y8_9TELE
MLRLPEICWAVLSRTTQWCGFSQSLEVETELLKVRGILQTVWFLHVSPVCSSLRPAGSEQMDRLVPADCRILPAGQSVTFSQKKLRQSAPPKTRRKVTAKPARTPLFTPISFADAAVRQLSARAAPAARRANPELFGGEWSCTEAARSLLCRAAVLMSVNASSSSSSSSCLQKRRRGRDGTQRNEQQHHMDFVEFDGVTLWVCMKDHYKDRMQEASTDAQQGNQSCQCGGDTVVFLLAS